MKGFVIALFNKEYNKVLFFSKNGVFTTKLDRAVVFEHASEAGKFYKVNLKGTFPFNKATEVVSIAEVKVLPVYNLK